MSFLRRKKTFTKDAKNNNNGGKQEEEHVLPLVDQKNKGHDGKPKEEPVSTAQCAAEWALTILFFLAFYYFTFSDKERANHKKQMDVQLAQLAEQFTAQKAALNTQLEGLYQQLFDEQAEQAVAAVDGGGDAPPTVAEQVIQAEIEHTKAEIDHAKAELTENEKKVQAFCPTCRYAKDGLVTSCGARRDYLMSRYGSPLEGATLAVIDWVPSCATGLN